MNLWYARIKAVLLRSKTPKTFVIVSVLIGAVLLFPSPASACSALDVPCHLMSGLSSIALWISSLIIKLIIVLIETLIPVMLYNNFSTAPVVTAGWAIVRDTVNMFFVVILIIIAFGTIFGHQKFQWRQQVPRLLIFAIVINFSKTLAGIMIDFGQVIMLTFANALREIAAGNFIQLFGLDKVYTATEANAGEATASVDLLLAGLASVFVLAWVLMLLLLLLAILIYRVVALWILIVLAPLAWFAGGAKDILQSNAYSEWWAQFKCLVAIGPVITFFLWLALAVAAGSGTEGFDTGGANLGSASGFFTQIFELQSFLSLVIGSAILMAGMQQAQSICSVMGNLSPLNVGRRALALSRGMTQRVGGWGARKVGGAARFAGRKAGRYVGAGAAKVPLLKYATKPGREQMWRGVAKAAGTGAVGKTLGRFAEKRAAANAGARAELIAKAGEKYKDDSMGLKVGQLKRFADSKAKTLGGKDEAKALFKEMMGSADMRKKFEEEGGDVQSLWRNYGGEMEKDYAGDDTATDQIKDFKKRYAHLTGATGDLKTKEDVESLSEEALADKGVRDRLAGLEVEVKVGGKQKKMSALDALSQGQMGSLEQRDALAGGYESLDDDQLRRADAASLVSSAALSTVEKTTELALNDGKAGRVDELLNKMLEQYKSSTSDADRFNFATAIDKLGSKLEAKLGEGGLSRSYEKQLRAVQQAFGENRTRAEETLTRPGSSTHLKFGAIPPAGEIPDAGAFVQTHFAGASDERKTEARVQVSERINGTNAEAYKQFQAAAAVVENARGKLDARANTLHEEIKGLWDSFRVARKASEDRAQQEADALNKQAKGKDRDIASKQQEFDRAAASGKADVGELGRLRDEKAALEREKAALETQANRRLAVVDQDADVGEIRQQIEVKQQEVHDVLAQTGGLNARSLEKAKPFLDAMEKAEQDRDRLQEILTELERLSPPTTST